MKKFIFIIMIFAALMITAAGCGNLDVKESPSNTISPDNTQSPGVTESHITIEPTNQETATSNLNPTGSPVNNPEDYVDGLMPEEYFSSIKSRNVKNLKDDELRKLIIDEAKSKDYNVYDLNDIKRSTVDNKKPAVDVDMTFRRLKDSNDMASTRFVFKGGRVVDTGTFDKIAEFKTPLLSKSKEAINNMKIASAKLNGIVLRENEEFSFRYFLGEQTKEDGYQEATVFVKDEDGDVEKEKGIGGGICQVSSTLHAVCLKLDLKIKERHPHSKGVAYIEEGKDAAIAGDYYDLKFVNILKHPIIIILAVDDKAKEEVVQIYKISFN